jgi:hypothetical protein
MLIFRNKNFAKLSLLLRKLGQHFVNSRVIFFSLTKVAKLNIHENAKYQFLENFAAATLPRAGLRALAPRCATALALATNSSAHYTSHINAWLFFFSFFKNVYSLKGQRPRDSVADP